MTTSNNTVTPDLVKDLYERWSAAFAADPEMPLEKWRALIEEWPQVTAEPGGVDYVEVEAGGMHPAQVEDVVSAYRWPLDAGIDPSHVAFARDSSGGGLVVTAMLLARDHGLPLPAAGMPLSPWFDYEITGASQDTNAETDKLLNKESGLVLAGMFLGESGDPQDPYVNPLDGNLAGLPPMFLQVSDAETLLDDSRTFAEQARDAGVELRLDVFPGQQHTFQMAAGRSPIADDAIERLADWVRPRLGL